MALLVRPWPGQYLQTGGWKTMLHGVRLVLTLSLMCNNKAMPDKLLMLFTAVD